MKDPRRERKRNCFDRLRARHLAASRARRADPATSAAMQLLSVFALVFGRMPPAVTAPAYVPYPPPLPSPASAHRSDMARRLRVPIRYLDLILSQGQVPYVVLFDHIRQGGVLRRDAMIELRKRVPEASLDWLDYIQKWGRWSDLIRCYVPREQDEETDVRVLKSTLLWLEYVKAKADRQEDLAAPLGSGIEIVNPDSDPQKPKP